MNNPTLDKRNSQPERKIEVLVITPQYAPDFGPSAPIYTALCEDLQQNGFNITVITAFPHYANAADFYQRRKKWFQEDRQNEVRVIRTYVYTVPKSSLWKRLLYQASFNVFSTLALLKVKKPDIVFADAPALWSGLPLTVRSLLGRVPFIYVVHDIYPDVLQRLGVMNNQNILNFIGRVEQFFYKRASSVSVLSEGFKKNLLQKGVPDEKVAIIPVCVDADFIHPLPRKNDCSQQWGLDDKFVALYAGNIGFSQGVEIVVQAAALLKDLPKIQFVIVGDGAMKAQLQQTADEMGLSNVKILPFQPRENVPQVYALADICLIPLKRDIVVESVPSKTYSIMASGRPFIATVDPNSEVNVLVEKAHCGLCVRPEDAKGLAEAVLKLYNDDALRIEMGKLGREHALEFYSRQVGTEKYSQLILKAQKK